MNKFTRIAYAAAFFITLGVLWEMLVYWGGLPRARIAPPSEVLSFLWHSAVDGSLLTSSFVTIRRLSIGFAVGLGLGFPLGILVARYRFCSDTLGTLSLGLQSLPSVCWAPLGLLWFGQTEFAMFFIVVMGSIWSVVLATSAGIRNVPPIYARVARTMGSRGIHTWLKVTLPASLPMIVTGMKQGWAFAWRSLMAAEIYVTIVAGVGLGHLLNAGHKQQAMDQVIGVMAMILIIGFATDRILFKPWEKLMHRRFGTSQT